MADIDRETLEKLALEKVSTAEFYELSDSIGEMPDQELRYIAGLDERPADEPHPHIADIEDSEEALAKCDDIIERLRKKYGGDLDKAVGKDAEHVKRVQCMRALIQKEKENMQLSLGMSL